MGSVKYCTLCGAALYDKSGVECRQLYDEDLHAKSGILKLVPCHACGADVADKYVEVDGTLLLIDLALQSKSAYRHVLLNASTSNAAAAGRTASMAGLVYKVALLTVICDGYTSWSSSAPLSGNVEFFEQEYEFYVACSKVILALLGFVTTAVIVNAIIPHCNQLRLKTLVFGLLLAYSSRFFNLMALLWSDGPWQQAMTLQGGSGFALSSANVMSTFVHVIFYISSVRVLQVAQLSDKSAGVSSWIQMAIAHTVFLCLLHMDRIFELQTCTHNAVR